MEKVQGRKVLVRENSVEAMREQAAADAGKAFYNEVRTALVEGWAMVPGTLNEAFPDVKTVGCEEFVRKWWEGVEVGKASWGEDRSFM